MKLDELEGNCCKLLQADPRPIKRARCCKLGLTKTPCPMTDRKLERSGIDQEIRGLFSGASHLPCLHGLFLFRILGPVRKFGIDRIIQPGSPDFLEVKECLLMGGASDFLLKPS